MPNREPNTTPGALELQRILRSMRAAGEEAVVIETSSHGLAADRVASVAYDGAIFTNLSHEHLDFHGTFEAYRDAKLSLFERLPRDAKGGRPGSRSSTSTTSTGRPSPRQARLPARWSSATDGRTAPPLLAARRPGRRLGLAARRRDRRVAAGRGVPSDRGPVQRPQRARGARAGVRLAARPAAGHRGVRELPGRARPDGVRAARAAVPCRHRLRPHARLAGGRRAGAGRARRAERRRRDQRLRRVGRARRREAAAHGRGRRAPQPARDRHRGRFARRGPGLDLRPGRIGRREGGQADGRGPARHRQPPRGDRRGLPTREAERRRPARGQGPRDVEHGPERPRALVGARRRRVAARFGGLLRPPSPQVPSSSLWNRDPARHPDLRGRPRTGRC